LRGRVCPVDNVGFADDGFEFCDGEFAGFLLRFFGEAFRGFGFFIFALNVVVIVEEDFGLVGGFG